MSASDYSPEVPSSLIPQKVDDLIHTGNYAEALALAKSAAKSPKSLHQSIHEISTR